MSDSLQKIIDDMKYDSDPGNEVDLFVALKEYIERLEALQKQPVAWMSEDGRVHTVDYYQHLACFSYNPDSVQWQTFKEITIPLIRAD